MKLNSYADKPYFSTIYQYNYSKITAGATSYREGTSPGVISSFNYFYPFPLYILLLVLYLVFIERFINTLTQVYPTINFPWFFFFEEHFFIGALLRHLILLT